MKCVEIKVVRNPSIQPTTKYVAHDEVECDGAPRIVYNMYSTSYGAGILLKIIVYDHQYREHRSVIDYVVEKALSDYITTSDIHRLAAYLDEEYDYIERKRGDEFTLIVNPEFDDP